jgi:hypothetical protein
VTRSAALAWLVRVLTAAGLGVDAGIHAYLAPSRPPGGDISQTDLFWFETAVAALAAVWVLATTARLAYAFAVLVAATALGAVLLYRYVDVGTLGPMPDMYEPFWYTSKAATAVAEAVTVLTAAAGMVLSTHGRRLRDAHRNPDPAPSAPH